jgi:serine/threonine-protein kinase
MKHALSPEVPARVRRGQLRTISLGIGASALAMACSFGEIDSGTDITPPGERDIPVEGGEQQGDEQQGDEQQTPIVDDEEANPPPDAAAGGVDAETYDPENDQFSTEMGKQVQDILRVNCGNCHIGQGASGDMGFILDLDQLITSGKVVPGNKEDSQIFVRMQQQTMPPAFERVQRPTYGQIDLVGQFIDQLDSALDEGSNCEPEQFMDIDQQIQAMANDIARQDAEDQPFIRYLTINYSSNAGECGRALQRQRYALFKGINSVSTETTVGNPQPIDDAETIYRIDIRDYDWDREIDLQDNDITDPANIDFVDGWEAIVAEAQPYALEYIGDDADQLKTDSGTTVPFMPVNAFIQATEFGDLYYTLVGARNNLFDFELDVLNIDTKAEIADDNLMRAGFENSGVSKQERVLNRFDSGLAAGLSYWLSFDFDGGNGGDGANGFERDVANESIFDNPLDFAFAGGEAIFSLPNGMQAYYVSAANGQRLATAPIGVVVDPAQNNGLVTNGASCHSCHNAGMITFTDTVRNYVENNRIDFDNDTFESVIAQYPTPAEFQRQMDLDSAVHVNATEEAGVPAGTPDPVSRVYLDFQLGDIDLAIAAGELSVPVEELKENINLLDPRLGNLLREEGTVSRPVMDDAFLDAVCILQAVNENGPANCQ